jgi:collagenase-like PrtC family protease
MGVRLKMKYSIGYQYFDCAEESFADIVQDFSKCVEEVYFPWQDQPSARSPAASASGLTDWESRESLEKDLLRLKEMNIKLNLLFNANCYGEKSISRELISSVCSIVSHLDDKAGLNVVSTTSLIIAETVKKYFPHIEIRASVNMRIGTIQGLEYVKDLFDSFCLQREINRDLQILKTIRKWSIANNKKISLLANSGCLNFCSAQTFHDNIVAHLKEINEIKNVDTYNPVLCQHHYSNSLNWISILRNSSWIRPEDVNSYEGIVSLMKLATRTHDNPRRVIQSYAENKFSGNLLDLTEPGHGLHFKGFILDNTLFPEDWFNTITNCKNECLKCSYCENLLKTLLKKQEYY